MRPLPRLVGGALAERLAVMPAVVVTGARQTGKSTLAEQPVQGERRYRTLDDFDVLDAARRDPEALVGGNEPVTLDEVQREPGLLSAVKRAIDRNRQPGRFLLTGSANLLLMRQVSESLAGRASNLTLWPMTRREQLGLGRDVALPQPTVHRWLNLLETSYLLVRLPAYAVNRTKRLIKAPKLFWGDTGIALAPGRARNRRVPISKTW